MGIMSSRHPPKDFSNTSKVVTKKNKQDPEVIIVANKIAGSKIFMKNKSDFYGAYIVLARRLSLVLEQLCPRVRAETKGAVVPPVCPTVGT